MNSKKICFKKYVPSGERLWLTPGSPIHNALKLVVMDTKLLNILNYFVEFKHTGNLEVCHSVMTKYVPKRLHFSHHGMIARTQLALLHFNSIVNAEQALTNDNVPWCKLQYSKLTYVVKQIKQVDSFSSGHELSLPTIPQFDAPTDRPAKEEVIRLQHSRFNAVPAI